MYLELVFFKILRDVDDNGNDRQGYSFGFVSSRDI